MPDPGITRPDLCSKRAAARQAAFADSSPRPAQRRRLPAGGDDPFAPMPHYAARTLVEASALRTFGYPDRSAGAPRDQPSRSADGGRAMTALATSSAGSRATAASSIDHAIRLSTAAAVLAVAGIAAYVSYWHAYAVVRAYGGSGITARLEPATIDGLVYASQHGHLVRGPAPGTGPIPGPLAARAGNRGHSHREHGPGLVTRSRRSDGRGLASGQPRGLLRTPGLAHPHLRAGGTRTTGQHSRNDGDLSAHGWPPKDQPARQAVTIASVEHGDWVPGAGTDNCAAVAAYRLSVQAGNPLSERKLAQMFGRTSRRWARARITEARQSP